MKKFISILTPEEQKVYLDNIEIIKKANEITKSIGVACPIIIIAGIK